MLLGVGMQFRVVFYETVDGVKPAAQFLEALRAKHPELHRLMLQGLIRIEDREHHRRPLVEMVDAEHRIYEVRVGGTNIARAFFFFQQGARIIVTNGYIKKRQKLDPRELERARRYKQDWEDRRK